MSRKPHKTGVVFCPASRAAAILSQAQLGILVRFLSIPPFPRTIEIPDFEHLVRTRITEERVEWPEQALSLVGYMAWPKDRETRETSIDLIGRWFQGSRIIPKRLLTIQRSWARVGDIFNIHMAMTAGGHEKPRGGPSLGKAIEVAHARIKSRGARKSNLWRVWEAYKDVAHLIASATIIAGNARGWAEREPIGKRGPLSDRLQPFHITLLMPDFVIALALSLQEYGLSQVAQGREAAMLDAETLWRIPLDINVVPVQPPERKITKDEKSALRARRAGNRGKKARQNQAGKRTENNAL